AERAPLPAVALERPRVALGERVAVEDEHGALEMRGGQAQRSRSAEWLGFDGPRERDVAGTIAELAPQLLGAVPREDHRVADALTREPFELPREERPAAERRERLRQGAEARLQPGAEPAREDECLHRLNRSEEH